MPAQPSITRLTVTRPVRARRGRPPMRGLLALLAPLLLTATVAAQQQSIAGGDVFATVDGTVINVEQYVVTLRSAVRNSYYHGQIPDAEMAAFQRRVASDLVDRVLLLDEATRRGIEADPARYAERIASIANRYANDAQFQRNRDEMLASLERNLAEADRIEQLEQALRALPPPSDTELGAYYEANLDKFQEPEQIKVSAILLKVDPSAPRSAWDAAREEAEQLRGRLDAGADFAELARLHSGDASAENGGDMGYLHRGMLGEPAQLALDSLAPGQVTEPIDLLEGIALFRLDERKLARQNSLQAVRERAIELLQRERSEQAWQAFKQQLRDQATITMREDLFLPESTGPAVVHGATPAPAATQ